MTGMKIVDSLEQLIRLTPNLLSIVLMDREGAPILQAGGEFRERSVLAACYISSIEQAQKLNMGHQKYWVFTYETYQIVVLHIEPFVVFLVATPTANTGVLCSFHERLAPILQICQKIVQDVSSVSA